MSSFHEYLFGAPLFSASSCTNPCPKDLQAFDKTRQGAEGAEASEPGKCEKKILSFEMLACNFVLCAFYTPQMLDGRFVEGKKVRESCKAAQQSCVSKHDRDSCSGCHRLP